MAQNLSDLIPKPYLGLQPVTAYGGLAYQRSHAQWVFEATDATAANTVWPQVDLQNDYVGALTGGTLRFRSQNNTPAFVSAGLITGQLTTLTPAAEVSKVLITVLIGGASKTVGVRGDLVALAPNVSNDFTLGTPAVRWGGVYITGDPTNIVQGDLTVDGTPSVLFGSASNHPVQIKTNSAIRVRIGAAGQMALNTAVDTTGLLAVAGTHPGAAVTVYGAKLGVTVPATATTAYNEFYSLPATAAAAFTCPAVTGFSANEPTLGAGSSITNYYGLSVTATGAVATNTYGLYVSIPTVGLPWAIYVTSTGSNPAPSYFGGQLLVGTTIASPGALEVTANAPTPRTVGINVHGATNGTALQIIEAGASTQTTDYIFKATDKAATQVCALRFDAVSFFGTTTTGTDPNAFAVSGTFNISGRVCLQVADNYNYINNTTSPTLIVVGTHTVPVNGQCYDIAASTSTSLANAGGVYSGLNFGTTITASANTSVGYGISGSMGVTGAGQFYGISASVNSNAGHTGGMSGIVVTVSPSATSSGAIGVNLTAGVSTQGAAASKVGVQIGNQALCSWNYGIQIIATINTWAFQYTEPAGATGGFLSLVDSGAVTRFSVDVNGNMLLGGTTRRITGDMDNGVLSNRVFFQTSTAGATTTVSAMPNGAGVSAGFSAYAANDPTNAAFVNLVANTGANATQLNSGHTGTGTTQPLGLAIDGTVALQAQTNKDVTLGPTGAITTMSAGFPYLPAVAGAPTGVPTARAGYVPAVYDTTNHKLWAYDGGAWKGVVLA